MKMTLLDKSECFRAFLLLVGRDRTISGKEHSFLLELGKKLDFEQRFCETSISDLLDNTFINLEPPVFSSMLLAETFVRDAVRVAYVDNDFHTGEFLWIVSIAKRNGLEEQWVQAEILKFREGTFPDRHQLEIEKYI